MSLAKPDKQLSQEDECTSSYRLDIVGKHDHWETNIYIMLNEHAKSILKIQNKKPLITVIISKTTQITLNNLNDCITRNGN